MAAAATGEANGRREDRPSLCSSADSIAPQGLSRGGSLIFDIPGWLSHSPSSPSNTTQEEDDVSSRFCPSLSRLLSLGDPIILLYCHCLPHPQSLPLGLAAATETTSSTSSILGKRRRHSDDQVRRSFESKRRHCDPDDDEDDLDGEKESLEHMTELSLVWGCTSCTYINAAESVACEVRKGCKKKRVGGGLKEDCDDCGACQ